MVEGGIDLDIPERVVRNDSETDFYLEAAALRPIPLEPEEPPTTNPQPDVETDVAEVVPPVGEAEVQAIDIPVLVQAESLRTVPGDDGKLVIELTGGVFVLRRQGNGSILELRADRAVVFTDLERLDDAGEATDWRERIKGVYLEGDVRASYAPPRRPGDDSLLDREQRLFAERAYYDFETDRATLTEAVLHTSADLPREVPITLRARVIKQLADGEYEALGAEISTSRFASPTYSLNAGRVFVRVDESANNGQGRTTFGGDNFTLRSFGAPLFYFPRVRGASLDSRLPLRSVSIGETNNFGTFGMTEWGLFETLGRTPPESVDATYSIDYFSERGPRVGFDATYGDDFFLPLQENRPTLFSGGLKLELLRDSGEDDLPGSRRNQPQDAWRGRADFSHQQFFPGGGSVGGSDFALTVRAGVVDDPTYLEQWDRRRFYEGPPHDFALTLERLNGNRRLAIDFAAATTSFATVADILEENAAVERFPELRFSSIGDRLGPVTSSSRVRVGVLAFDNLSRDIADDFNFGLPVGSTLRPFAGYGGIPAYGYTGKAESATVRADFREELALPLSAGPVRVVPFVVGRFTAYSDSPEGDAIARGLGGVGVRVGTVFSRVDDSIYSRILDLDRGRHLIEPYAGAFAGWASHGRDEVLVYDQGIDDYDSVSGYQVGLRQRWQTYRGPSGKKRSVDVLDLNLSANVFGRGREETINDGPVGPVSAGDFRGLYFGTEPESSLTRDTGDATALWRVSDSMALVGDAAVQLETGDLITAAAGLIVDRGGRLTYSVGGRYVEPLDQTLLSAVGSYDLSDRYTIRGATRFDLEANELRDSAVGISRRYEKVTLDISLYIDRIDDDRGIRVMLRPNDLPIPGFGVLGD